MEEPSTDRRGNARVTEKKNFSNDGHLAFTSAFSGCKDFTYFSYYATTSGKIQIASMGSRQGAESPDSGNRQKLPFFPNRVRLVSVGPQ